MVRSMSPIERETLFLTRWPSPDLGGSILGNRSTVPYLKPVVDEGIVQSLMRRVGLTKSHAGHGIGVPLRMIHQKSCQVFLGIINIEGGAVQELPGHGGSRVKRGC